MSNNQPDWSKSSQWNEFEWELAMRSSDDFACRYFNLLDQYGDFPGAENYIQAKLDDKLPDYPEDDFMEYEIEDFFEQSEGNEAPNEDSPIFSGIYYETQRSYRVLRQVSIGWCNIFATHLTPEKYLLGTHILYHLGRATAHLASSLADGKYTESLAVHIASGKRAMKQLNEVLGLIAHLPQTVPSDREIRDALHKHLCEVQQEISDHLVRLQTLKPSKK